MRHANAEETLLVCQCAPTKAGRAGEGGPRGVDHLIGYESQIRGTSPVHVAESGKKEGRPKGKAFSTRKGSALAADGILPWVAGRNSAMEGRDSVRRKEKTKWEAKNQEKAKKEEGVAGIRVMRSRSRGTYIPRCITEIPEK